MPCRRLLLVFALALLGGCTEKATPVSVENRAGVEIQSVVVSGAGFEQHLGNLVPGARTTTQVRPTGESGLSISFRANDKVIALPSSGYFEGGGQYVVTAVVTPELKASVDARLKAY